MAWLDLYYYSISENKFPSDKDALLKLLDEYEVERFNRYKFDQSRWTFATARWITKTQLAKKLNSDAEKITFSYLENGKPVVNVYKGIEFSISHTDTAILVGISDKPVGVDIELHERRGQPWKNAADYLNQRVAKVIDALEGEEEKKLCFSRYWTSMESRVKLRGDTLFEVKSKFADALPALEQDGSYFDTECRYYTSGFKDKEQITICTEEKIAELDVKTFAGRAFVSDEYLAEKLSLS